MPVTQEESNEGRLLALLDFAVAFGTLWHVPEDIWEETCLRKSVPYDMHSNRKGHPGVSLRDERFCSLPSVPLLMGNSKTRNARACILCSNVYGDCPGRKTWFGGLPPLQIPGSYFLGTGASRKIRPTDKGSLSPQEKGQLEALVKRFPWGTGTLGTTDAGRR